METVQSFVLMEFEHFLPLFFWKCILLGIREGNKCVNELSQSHPRQEGDRLPKSIPKGTLRGASRSQKDATKKLK
jgi:hypothetical protein